MFEPSDRDVELSEEEFRLLRDFVHEKFGLYFGEAQRGSLRSRLLGRLSSLGLLSFEDYYHYLRFGPQREEELDRMVSYLTNNETYFFRERAQLDVLARTLLTNLRERKAKSGDRSLRILSAGCSTGEEVHTLAMIIYDSGQFFWNWDVQIFGMDVDRAALDKARRAVYFHNSFRGLDPTMLARHFVKENGGAKVKEGIRKTVHLRLGNLMDPASYQGLKPLDIILCRNVLIYFSDESLRRVVRQFYDTLAAGGYLLLGHAESLSRLTDIFTPVRFPGAMVYQKPLDPSPRRVTP
jgi:chemotaxis protein methyltransferase CheR